MLEDAKNPVTKEYEIDSNGWLCDTAITVGEMNLGWRMGDRILVGFKHKQLKVAEEIIRPHYIVWLDRPYAISLCSFGSMEPIRATHAVFRRFDDD